MEPSGSLKQRLSFMARAALACGGMVALGLLIRSAGADAVKASLLGAAPWLPLLLTLEVARIGLEVVSTRHLLGSAAPLVSWRELFRLQLMAYGICTLAPAGRPASEAAKAAGLAPRVGKARAAAVAAHGQALNLLGEAAISGTTVLALSLLAPWSLLGSALLVHFVTCAGMALILQLGVRTRLLETALRRFPRPAAAVAALRMAARTQPGIPPVPFLMFAGSKALQVINLCLLLRAGGLELDALRVTYTAALNSLASAVGDLVPAQLGATDGVFALGANLLAVPLGAVLGATALFHCVQLFWVSVTALSVLVWRPGDEPATPAWQPAKSRTLAYKAFAAMLRQ